MNNIDSPVIVEKEEIILLQFPETEVLTEAEHLAKREYELNRLSLLGNNDQVKMKIIFEDSEGIKQVETTTWAVTDMRIILKQGITIPIIRIHEIKM
jgi:hypothetical protein